MHLSCYGDTMQKQDKQSFPTFHNKYVKMLFMKNLEYLSRLLFVLRLLGTAFLCLQDFSFVIKRFVFCEQPEKFNSKQHKEEALQFEAEVKTFLYTNPNITKNTPQELFKQLNYYGLQGNSPIGKVLVTDRLVCRQCKSDLVVDKKHHTVVVYDLQMGVFKASRAKKLCRKCKISEHYGYWTCQGKKHYNEDALTLDYLLTSEETAFDINLLNEMDSLFVVGSMPFSTYASVFNRRFGLVNRNKER